MGPRYPLWGGVEMTKPSVTVDTARSGGHLEPDAINVTEDTIIGMAASAPAASVGLTLAALAGAHAYGGRPHRLRQRPDHHPHRDPDADHRQRLPQAEHVERQRWGVVRVGRPGHQPIPRFPD